MSRLPSRDDSVTTQLSCASCHSPLPRVRGRQRYCNPAYRQRAYRDRQGHPDDIVVEPASGRRSSGVYQCPNCDTRYDGQQRCEDCNVFCTRIGTGGTCPLRGGRHPTNCYSPEILQVIRNNVVSTQAGQLHGTPTTVGTGLDHPFGMADDQAGDVFIADTGNDRVVMVPAGGGPQTTVGTGLNNRPGWR